jgi:hypothetical protein
VLNIFARLRPTHGKKPISPLKKARSRAALQLGAPHACNEDSPNHPMKTSLLILSLVSLSLTGFSATADNPNEISEQAVQLPSFEITVARLSPDEIAMRRSVEQMRAEALKPMVVKVDLPVIKLNPVEQPKTTIATTTKPVVVAGL